MATNILNKLYNDVTGLLNKGADTIQKKVAPVKTAVKVASAVAKPIIQSKIQSSINKVTSPVTSVAKKVNTVKAVVPRLFQAAKTAVAPTVAKKVEEVKKASLIPQVAKFATDVARAGPRAGASIALQARGEKAFVPSTGIEKALLGSETIHNVPGTGETFLRDVGASNDVAKRFALPVGIAMTAMDVTPPITGGKAGEEGVENLIKRNADDVAKLAGDVADIAKDLLSGEERGFVTTIKESPKAVEELKNLVKGRYNPITNKETLERAATEIAQDFNKAYKEVLNPASKFDATTNAKGLLLMQRFQDRGEYQIAADIAEAMAKKGTTAGQYIQSFSIWNRMQPEGMLYYAQKQVDKANEARGFLDKFFKRPEIKLSPEVAEQVITKMKQAQEFVGEEKSKIVKEVLELINKEIPPSASELFDAYRYQNILSSPRTQERNIFANAAQTALVRPTTLLLESGIDWVKSALTGKAREAYISDVPQYYKGLANSWSNAIEAFSNAWKGTTNITQPDIAELRTQNLPKSLTVITRLMEGADKFFQTMLGAGEYAARMNRGMEHSQALQEAERVAQYSLLRKNLDPTNTTGQGALLSKIDQLTDSFLHIRSKVPGMGWVVPFVKTPMNAVKQWIEYSPAGVLTMAGNTHKSEQAAKALLGSLVTLYGAKRAMDGDTTWAAPTDKEAKQLFYASGKKPFSFRPAGSDKWIPFTYLGPLGLAAAIPAAVRHYYEDNPNAAVDTELEKALKSSGAILEFLTGQTYTAGVENYFKLLQGDVDYSLASNLGYTGQQIEPLIGLVRYVNSILDPVFRKKTNFTESMFGDLPGVSKNLLPQMEPGGVEAKRLPANYVLPWDIGVDKPEYDERLQTRNLELRVNKIKSLRSKLSGIGRDEARGYIGHAEAEKKRQEAYDDFQRALNDFNSNLGTE